MGTFPPEHICAHSCHPLLFVPFVRGSFNSAQWVVDLGVKVKRSNKVKEFSKMLIFVNQKCVRGEKPGETRSSNFKSAQGQKPSQQNVHCVLFLQVRAEHFPSTHEAAQQTNPAWQVQAWCACDK